MTPITKVTISPNYAEGFTFAWEVIGSLLDPGPWYFTVEQAPAPAGPWTALSPVIQVYRWSEEKPRRVSKDEVLYFRVRLQTPKAIYYSATIMPYGDLNRREYLLVRDIMRREVLHASTLAGVQNQLWLVSTFGPRCTVCLDPITGGVRDSACKACFGTGRAPAYHGPYATWCLYTPVTRTTQMSEDGTGTRQPRDFELRLIGSPPLKKNDLIVDTRTDKRYYVDVVKVVSEIRRVPAVQTAAVREVPTSDVAYKVGRA